MNKAASAEIHPPQMGGPAGKRSQFADIRR